MSVSLCGQEFGVAFPRIHGLVYAPGNGVLKTLPVDFKSILRKYSHVYDLYNEGEAPAAAPAPAR